MLLSKEKLKFTLIKNLIKHFTLVIFLIFIIFTLISYYYLFLPKYRQIKELKEIDFALKQTDFSQKNKHLKNFQELKKNYEAVSPSDLIKVQAMVPAEADIAGLLVQLQNIGQAYNSQLLSINVIESKEITKKTEPKEETLSFSPKLIAQNESSIEAQNVRKINVQVQYQGLVNYPLFKSFLAGFENNIRLFDINNLGFALSKSGGSSSIINLSFTTYYLAD